MTSKRRGGLGRGIGALIPSAPSGTTSPTDIFFGGGHRIELDATATETPATETPSHGTPVDDPPVDGIPTDQAGGGDDETSLGDEADEVESANGTAVDASPDVAGSVEAPHEAEQMTDPGADAILAPVPGAHLEDLPLEQIHPNARQPRTVFDDDALAELTHSVREFGVLQPVVVRRLGDGAGYELVMGERRLRAATAAGLATIPAVVRDTTDDDMLRNALLENIHRAQLNPLEEAAAYQQLLDDFGVTHEELAARIGRSRSHLSNTVRLMNLPVPVQRRVAAGVLSAGHARALLGLPDADQQDELASRIVAEGLSVRATEEAVTMAIGGHCAVQTQRRPARRFTAPAAAELADRLSDVYDTRVRVDIGQRKGKITVEFASIDDLERIVAIMAPTVGARSDAQPSDTGVSSGSTVDTSEG